MLSRNTEFGHLVAAYFLAIGIAGLGFPYRLQATVLKKRPKFWGFENPFLGWMKTKSYIWMLRVIGTVSIIAALFIEFVILSSN